MLELVDIIGLSITHGFDDAATLPRFVGRAARSYCNTDMIP
ncbi:hypothetical protein PT2222_300089 [Paraburkholderia tropica]